MKGIVWLSVVIGVKCTHVITHAVDMLMSMWKLGNLHSLWEFELQRLCRGGRLPGHRELAHVFAKFCMTMWDDCIVLRDLGLEFCMRLFHDPWYT